MQITFRAVEPEQVLVAVTDNDLQAMFYLSAQAEEQVIEKFRAACQESRDTELFPLEGELEEVTGDS